MIQRQMSSSSTQSTDAEIIPMKSSNEAENNDSSTGVNDIMLQIANQANLVRRNFENTTRRSNVSFATMKAAQQMVSKNNKRKNEGDMDLNEIYPLQSKAMQKARHFHSPISSFTRSVDTKSDSSNASSPAPQKPVRISDGIILNSPPDEIHLTYNDVVCGRGNMTAKLVGNQRYNVWLEMHRKSYAKAPMNEEREQIARSIVNTVESSVPKGRFLQLDIHSGLWQEVGYEAAVKITMDALSEEPKVTAIEPQSAKQNTYTSMAA